MHAILKLVQLMWLLDQGKLYFKHDDCLIITGIMLFMYKIFLKAKRQLVLVILSFNTE